MRLRICAAVAVFILQGCVRFGASVVGGQEPHDRPQLTKSLMDSSALAEAPPLDLPAEPHINAPELFADTRQDAPGAAPDVPDECSPGNICPPTQHCDMASRACADGCASDEGCALAISRRYCDSTLHLCARCLTDAHCGAAQACVGGACAPTCTSSRPCFSGQTCCNGACVDPSQNPSHCGGCGRACALTHSAAVCTSGRCAVGLCVAPFGDCNNNTEDGCEVNTYTDPSHCGACGALCPLRPHTLSTCVRGVCSFTCAPGFSDCNSDPADGCESELSSSAGACGACGVACRPPHAAGACARSTCAVGACEPGFADCDREAGNGCEADTRASSAHCGACGAPCSPRANAVSSCVGGSCVLRCATGFADCDNDPFNGCETDARTKASSCGACWRSCGARACVAGACAPVACDPGLGDCNATGSCDVALSTSPAHCGACGHSCPTEQVCSLGTCSDRCRAPEVLCAGSCSDVSSDPLHCGSCAIRCPAGQRCVSGQCRLVCSAPLRVCGESCVDTLSDVERCGGCDSACPATAHASRACLAGRCQLRCDEGFGDCDANGSCEAQFASDAAHCSGCATRCLTAHGTPRCDAGACAVAACEPGYQDCNGVANDGCEADTMNDLTHCGACENSCVSGTLCAMGECVSGVRPALVVSNWEISNVNRASVTARATSREALISNVVGGFAPGHKVLLHQSRSATDAGSYEFNVVRSVRGSSVTLRDPLARSYLTAEGSRAQMVEVGVYLAVRVGPEAMLTAPTWNGSHGGILVIEASGDVDVQGRISMDGRGFRGARHDDRCPLRCATGTQGESPWGTGRPDLSNNGAGGGGGERGSCGAGAGGGYGAPGANGARGDCLEAPTEVCSATCQSTGGSAGEPSGTADLRARLLFGSAGGEGGADNNGALPGFGGNGGGVIFVRARSIRVTGSISSSGASGTDGNQFACVASTACGMGGGGGGAGGAVRIDVAASADLGDRAVRALGGAGGVCSCRRAIGPERASIAGNGGLGRIGLRALSRSGATTPEYDPN